MADEHTDRQHVERRQINTDRHEMDKQAETDKIKRYLTPNVTPDQRQRQTGQPIDKQVPHNRQTSTDQHTRLAKIKTHKLFKLHIN